MSSDNGTKRRVLQLVVGAAVAAMLLLAAVGVLFTRDSDASDGLDKELTTVARAERGRGQVALAQATAFGWSQFHAFHAYTDANEVERKLGFAWEGADWALTGSDGQSLVAFTD